MSTFVMVAPQDFWTGLKTQHRFGPGTEEYILRWGVVIWLWNFVFTPNCTDYHNIAEKYVNSSLIWQKYLEMLIEWMGFFGQRKKMEGTLNLVW